MGQTSGRGGPGTSFKRREHRAPSQRRPERGGGVGSTRRTLEGASDRPRAEPQGRYISCLRKGTEEFFQGLRIIHHLLHAPVCSRYVISNFANRAAEGLLKGISRVLVCANLLQGTPAVICRRLPPPARAIRGAPGGTFRGGAGTPSVAVVCRGHTPSKMRRRALVSQKAASHKAPRRGGRRRRRSCRLSKGNR